MKLTETKDFEAMRSDLNAIREEYSKYASRKEASKVLCSKRTFVEFKESYPMFTRLMVEYLVNYAGFSKKEVNDLDFMNENWGDGYLIYPEDWPVLFTAADKVLNEEVLYWNTLGKADYSSDSAKDKSYGAADTDEAIIAKFVPGRTFNLYGATYKVTRVDEGLNVYFRNVDGKLGESDDTMDNLVQSYKDGDLKM